jgi:tRNA-splicing ligase RtcB
MKSNPATKETLHPAFGDHRQMAGENLGQTHRPGRLAALRLYASDLLSPSQEELEGLERVARLPEVSVVVALPDLHIKPALETPSSVATACRDHLILGLTSPSPGCGMALVATALGESDLSPDRLDAMFASLVRRLPAGSNTRPQVGGEFKPVIERILMGGAKAAVEHYGLDPALLESIERSGQAFPEAIVPGSAEPGDPEADLQAVLASLPEWSLDLARREFGQVGGGNHFLELQVVDELVDAALASEWNLHPGQVVVMYHADSSRFGALAGRLYAHRRKNTRRGRIQELRYKSAFHLAQSRSLPDLYRRGRYYFSIQPHMPIPAGLVEARRAQAALAAATNYAYANRVAILAALAESLAEVWGTAAGQPGLVYDVSHNGIQAETVAGDRLWVHRHNASRALPAGHPGLAGSRYAASGQPLLLPGTHRTSSYLSVARPGTAESLYSVDHGAGRSAARLGSERQDSGLLTRVYGYSGSCRAEETHLSDNGVGAVVEILREADLARPVARLRPLAVLKDTRR